MKIIRKAVEKVAEAIDGHPVVVLIFCLAVLVFNIIVYLHLRTTYAKIERFYSAIEAQGNRKATPHQGTGYARP